VTPGEPSTISFVQSRRLQAAATGPGSITPMRLLGALLIAAGILLLGAVSAFGVSAKPGQVIVGDSERARVFTLDPSTGDRKVLSKDPRLVNPNDSAFSPNGNKLYVADYGAFGGEGGVFKINPDNGKTGVLAKQHGFEQPDGIAVAPNGAVYVTDLDATDDNGALFRVNPATGKVRLVASGDLLVDALGVVVQPNGKPVVSSATDSVIVRVDPQTGDQHTIADSGDGLTGVGGIARGSNGTLYIGTSAAQLESVDPATGEVDAPVEFGFINAGYGLGIDRRGRVLGTNGSEVYRANPSTGNVKLVGEGFVYAEGLEVVPR
jgi:streptogramin lyase